MFQKTAKILIILSFLGIIDAGYITMKFFTGGEVICPLTGGCSDVLTSPYSKIFGYPVSLYGLIFYLIIFILSFLYLGKEREIIWKIISGVSVFGFLFTLWFVYLQLFVIKAICFYCMVSAILATLIFLSIILAYFRKK